MSARRNRKKRLRRHKHPIRLLNDWNTARELRGKENEKRKIFCRSDTLAPTGWSKWERCSSVGTCSEQQINVRRRGEKIGKVKSAGMACESYLRVVFRNNKNTSRCYRLSFWLTEVLSLEGRDGETCTLKAQTLICFDSLFVSRGNAQHEIKCKHRQLSTQPTDHTHGKFLGNT